MSETKQILAEKVARVKAAVSPQAHDRVPIAASAGEWPIAYAGKYTMQEAFYAIAPTGRPAGRPAKGPSPIKPDPTVNAHQATTLRDLPSPPRSLRLRAQSIRNTGRCIFSDVAF